MSVNFDDWYANGWTRTTEACSLSSKPLFFFFFFFFFFSVCLGLPIRCAGKSDGHMLGKNYPLCCPLVSCHTLFLHCCLFSFSASCVGQDVEFDCIGF